MEGRSVALVVLLLATPLMSKGNDDVPLRVLILHSSLRGEFNSNLSLPAVNIALDHVNNSAVLLNGYSVQTTRLETEVMPNIIYTAS